MGSSHLVESQGRDVERSDSSWRDHCRI
jgi:hypothetical protein